jgi:hypothetical protein
VDFIGGDAGLEVLGGLLMLGDWMTPHPRQPRRVAVPDVRGLGRVLMAIGGIV